MIVYHGSNHNFKNLRISEKLSGESTLGNEGAGIYFSSDLSVAMSYGKYVYTLEIRDDAIKDFRNPQFVQGYLNGLYSEVYKTFRINLARFVLMPGFISEILNWQIGIVGIAHEIGLILDSSYEFYQTGVDYSQVEKFVANYVKKTCKVYFFPYYINGVGVSHTVDKNIIRIVEKDRRI